MLETVGTDTTLRISKVAESLIFDETGLWSTLSQEHTPTQGSDIVHPAFRPIVSTSNHGRESFVSGTANGLTSPCSRVYCTDL